MLGMFQLAVLLFTLVPAILAQRYTDCAGNGNLVNVTVTPCTQTPCEIRRYTRTELAITFRADQLITGGRAGGVYWVWNWFPHRPSLDDSPMCKSTTPSCPFQPNGTVYTYRWILNTGGIVASGKLTWKLFDQNDREFICVDVPLQS